MSEINFIKIQSTGNDFIVVDFNQVTDAFFEKETIVKICHRHFGVGADGVIALEKLKDYAFRFHYYNADGSRAAMCGNGLRAAIRFAYDKKWVGEKEIFRFKADDGEHQGQVFNGLIKASILVKDQINKLAIADFNLPDWIDGMYQINTGVPHIVLTCTEDIKNKEIFTLGRELRYHDAFSHGTNVNFVKIIDMDRIYLRTYERGVENETLSCGTGMTASSLVMKSYFDFSNEIDIIANGGNLKVTFEKDNIFIQGPSECSFKGTIVI